MGFDVLRDSGGPGGIVGGVVTAVTGTLPVTSTGGSSPAIGLTVTPAHPGGAVALQAASPGTVQTGNINLSGDGIFGGDFHVVGKLTVDGAIDPSSIAIENKVHGDAAVAPITFSATDSNSNLSTVSWGIELPGDGASAGDLVARTTRVIGGEMVPRLTIKGHSNYFEFRTGILITPEDDFVVGGGEGRSVILRSDMVGPITHANEINVLGIDDEIDVTFLSAAAGGLYIRPTFLEPQDDNLQLLGNVAHRWKTIYAGTGTAALASIGAGTNGTVNLAAATPGVAGNAFTVEVVAGVGNNVAMSVAYAAPAFTVTLGTDGGGALDPTKNAATLIAAAAAWAANGVTATASGTGADPLTGAEGPTTFVGGAEAITAAGKVNAAGYFAGDTPGLASFSGAVTNITIKNGIVTAAS